MPGSGSVYPITDPKGRPRWIAQWSIGGRGRRRYVKRTRRTEREAKAALKELRDEYGAQRSVTRMKLGAYLERWVREVRNLRVSTRTGYASLIALHIAPTIGHVRLDQLTPMHIETMLTEVALHANPRTGEPISARTLRNVHAVLRRALRHAVRAGLVSRNVASREYVDAPRIPDLEPESLTASEIRRLLVAIRGHRLEALFVVAVGTGLRSGELRGLVWEDVELRGGLLHVRKELVRRDRRYFREELKTRRSRRTVPLAPALVRALSEHRERLIAAGWIPIPAGPVFVSSRGQPLNGGTVTHEFYDLCRKAGIKRRAFKVLRATFATRLFEAGVLDRRIRDLMGHERDSRVTHGHYIGAGDDWAPAVAAIEELVG